MILPRRCTAIKPGLALAALLVSGAACAGPVGVVSNLGGLLLVKSESGSLKVLATDSIVEEGEVLATRKDTYAQVTLADHTVLALGPDTELAVERYSFHEATPDGDTSHVGATAGGDSAVLRLAKGRVRIATGVLGTRVSDTFTLVVESATVDVRRSTAIFEYVLPVQADVAWSGVTPQTRRAPATFGSSQSVLGRYRYVATSSLASRTLQPLELSDGPMKSDSSWPTAAAIPSSQLRLAQNAPPAPVPGALAPGLYVQVIDGMINLSNQGGSQNFAAGQFGYTASIKQPPVIVPSNPGMQFTPPPAFSAPPTTGSTSGAAKSGTVDCVVR